MGKSTSGGRFSAFLAFKAFFFRRGTRRNSKSADALSTPVSEAAASSTLGRVLGEAGASEGSESSPDAGRSGISALGMRVPSKSSPCTSACRAASIVAIDTGSPGPIPEGRAPCGSSFTRMRSCRSTSRNSPVDSSTASAAVSSGSAESSDPARKPPCATASTRMPKKPVAANSAGTRSPGFDARK